MQIARNTVATIEYTLSSSEGKVLDTSRNREPIMYLHGAGGILPGLEMALEGKKAGEAVKITLPPEQAYGPRDPRLLIDVPRKDFTGAASISVGMKFKAGDEPGARVVTVVGIEGETVKVDANHPYAGLTVTVEATIVDVRPAKKEEIEHGHVCYGDHSCAHRPTM
jgi:FKBP-type peptidyl-prolyl cis-trans isomerase SlyD